jgi:hypothetical protein
MEFLTRPARRRRAGALAWGLAAAVSVSLSGAPATQLAVPGRSNATPSITSDGAVVAIAWGASTPAGATDVYTAVSGDGGRTFGGPVRVNDVDGDARLNGEQPPRVAVHHNVVTVIWTSKAGNGTRLVQARSENGGRTFGKATSVPGSDAAGNRGWENAAADRNGRVYAVWLDHRELAQQDGAVAAAHHDHAAASGAKPDGVAMAQRSKLYLASTDGAIPPRAITGGVCYCCKTALATAAGGAVFAAWRHVYPGNIRDIAFTASHDGGNTFAPPLRVSEDQWVLEGCPDDGPAMAVDAKNRIHIVWPTLITDKTDGPTIALFYATSADGRSFTPRQRIPTEGMPHHPQIAIAGDGTLTVAWDEGANGKRRAAVAQARVDAAGGARFTRTALADGAVYPVVAAAPDGIVAAWTSASGPASVIRVERIAPQP